ncbi:MAG: hypothetical protein SFW36_14300 [Leptolyngbyaceae cyanobacterium bins.59]|nr:hypothetical protein [Leptolyngbyaceae cyanobacterium bins.59]
MKQESRFNFDIAKVISQKDLVSHRVDIVIALILAVFGGITSFLNAQQIPDAVTTDFYAQDAWFGSDIPTVFGNISSTQSDFGRNNKHPLFPILIYPIVFGLGKILSLDSLTSTRVVVALVAALWLGFLYGLFRLMGCRLLDATLFTLVGAVSSASFFWFAVPESFSFGSLTILLALFVVAVAQHRKVSPLWYVGVGIVGVGVTITNWMAGLLATFVSFRWKKALTITGVTFVIVNGLWILQRIVFRNSGFPFSPKTFFGEKKFISGPESDSVLGALSSFAYKTIVMPAIQITDSTSRPGWPKFIANPLALGSSGMWGTIATVAWTGLLILGIWGFFSTQKHPRLRIVLGLTILGQMFLHSIYGTSETFIYALHFAPLLVTLAAFSSLTRLRWVGLALAAVLVVSAGINNRSQFHFAAMALMDYGTPQQQLQAQIHARPSDHWPRSAGHVLLASPGSVSEAKAYYEPGGSFSPMVGSFGVSIWVVDDKGNLKATSDEIPLSQIQQKLIYASSQALPAIEAKTDYYQASWSLAKPGIWQLKLTAPVNAATKPVIVIRSAGPAGGAVKTLNWDGTRLRINDRWTLTNTPNFANVYLGSERSSNWTRDKATAVQTEDARGWAYARLELPPGESWNLFIEDTIPPSPSALTATPILANLQLNLPDPQFASSLQAQLSHLMMGMVGTRTRPMDPVSYALPRFRDGAYEMVALARAGQLEVARQLSSYFAETDFLNGIQMDIDIPSVGIWALTAVAQQINQPEYDQWMWPHLQRKVKLIQDLIASNRPGYPTTQSVKVPFSEYPDFLSFEMAAGNMAGTQGLISLDYAANIMGYRALQDAATIAERLKRSTEAAQWRSQAQQLRKVWQEDFDQQFAGLDAIYTSGLWPSGIAYANQKTFEQGLQSRWNETHDDKGDYQEMPVEPYFNLAEAHQWLYLDRADRVWSTLKWFWDHQASPGLYTWWGPGQDGSVPESFSRWHQFRGWANPPYATPHYWTAAEMLLLQLDMLAYVDESESSQTLVLGSGIPAQWLNQPLSVKGLFVGGQRVNWAWDGKQVNVQVQGDSMKVRLGQAFPSNTVVKQTVIQPSELTPT